VPVAIEARRVRTALRRALPGALSVLLWSGIGRAAPPEASAPGADPGRSKREMPLSVGDAHHLLADVSLGRGVRLDNPYRLETELGKNAESLSLTATYLDLGIGAAFGLTRTVFHGLSVHGSFAQGGIRQEVVTPSYLVMLRSNPRWALLGRLGIPVVVEPDVNAGFELSGGALLYLTAGLGLTASLVGSMFYGAATLDTPRTAIPVLSLEAGAFFDYEVLP